MSAFDPGHLTRKIDSLLPEPAEIERYFDRLWPICRSITGNGFRESLATLSELCPYEKVEVPSGKKVLDWTIPNEWNIDDAYILGPDGSKVVDFKKNNLHILGYSIPVDQEIDLEELQKHLYSLPDKPDAIPYFTSYYKERWGFCLTENQRRALKPGKYRVVVRSKLAPGHLTYGHMVLSSTQNSKDEVLLSSYLCHPSMANNEISGPLVTSFLARALAQLENRRYNYRFVLVPETIGAITYLDEYGDHLKRHCTAGLEVTCCGDDRTITYMKSRLGDKTIDRVAANVLQHHGKKFEITRFIPAGSDERQYCSPGFDLPVGSLMRSKYATYPEYHTSLDNKSIMSFTAMRETIALYLKVILSLEENHNYVSTQQRGEPMLGPRGLYPSLGSQQSVDDEIMKMMWMFTYADGSHDLCAIAERAEMSVLGLAETASVLFDRGLLTK